LIAEESLVWYKQTVHGLHEMASSPAQPAADVEIYDDLSSRFSVAKGEDKNGLLNGARLNTIVHTSWRRGGGGHKEKKENGTCGKGKWELRKRKMGIAEILKANRKKTMAKSW
jgi:hypothetical protein